ncbi:MAG: hypothetical protein ABIY55_04405 [Kofleriaceae bacterium]
MPEDCGTAGDEDGNGLADCADPVCAALPACQPTHVAVCGDGQPDPGEGCDDGNMVDGDECETNCTRPVCGNSIRDVGESCDGGGNATATCNADCTVAMCGDGKLNLAAGELCDGGGAATATCDADCTAPRCGDGELNTAAGEEVDSPTSPSTVVPVNPQTCRFDFSAITQLFCAGTCGAWGGGNNCQQQDADALCKLRTGNPSSVATTFALAQALAAPGICCPTAVPITGCIALGTFTDRGVTLPISVDESDLKASHGPGQVVTNVVCTDP